MELGDDLPQFTISQLSDHQYIDKLRDISIEELRCLSFVYYDWTISEVIDAALCSDQNRV